MKALLKQLASESLIYGLSGFISRFVSVFLVPLYTRMLQPADYGVLGLVNNFFYFIGIVVVFALDNSVARWFYDSSDEIEKRKPVATWFWFQFAMALLICFVLVLLSSPLSHLILNLRAPELMIIPAITVVASVLPTIIWNWLRLQRKPWQTIILSTGNVLLTILLNLLLVLYFKMGIRGILIATLISNFIFSAVAIIMMKDWLSIRYFSKRLLNNMLRYALPLVPTSFAFWVLNSASLFFLNLYWSKTEVGLYSIGMGVASIVSIIVGAFQMAWGPFAFSIMHKAEARQVYSAVLTLYTAVACMVALGVALFSKEILYLLTTPQYYDAVLVSGLLAFNGIIYGYAYIGSIGSSIAKKTSPVAVAVLFGSVVTLLAYYLLVPRFGKEGAALSTLLGYLVIPFYVFYRSQKLWPVPYKYWPSFIMLLAAFLVFLFSTTLSTANFWNGILLKSSLYIVFLLLMAAVIYSSYKKQLSDLVGRTTSRLGLVR